MSSFILICGLQFSIYVPHKSGNRKSQISNRK